MVRRAKPARGQTEAKRRLARKAPKEEAARVRDLEKRLTESLEREKATGEILQEKNRALTEAVEQQTATREILRVISSSPTDVQPVFDAIAEAALRLCGAASSLVTTFDGELLHLCAQAAISPEGTRCARLGSETLRSVGDSSLVR